LSDDAVSNLAGVSNVYVIEGGKVRQQAVTLGARIGDLYELLDGLKGDEVLASSNLTMLATGVPVKPASDSITPAFPSGSGSEPKPGRNPMHRGGRP
jgi:hypothetical protein